MIQKNRILILLLLLISVGYSALGQEASEKYEKEISVKKEEFPEKALKIAAPILEKSNKITFYKEIGSEDKFYEFKSRYKGEYISVKFTEEGELLDIEILRDLKELPKDVQKAITEYFNTNYKKYQLSRIQIQYNREEEYEEGELEIDEDEEYVEEFLEMDVEDLIVRYEIEAETVDPSNNRGFFEFLFNSNGQMESIRKIVTRADDNVLY